MTVHDDKPRALLLWRECLLQILKKPIGILAVGFFVVFIISLIGIYQVSRLNHLEKQPSNEFVISDNEELQSITVDVQGAVERPGIYEFPEETRLIEVIRKAQGLSSRADKHVVAKTFNLSKKVTDEEKIYIPFIEERQDSANTLLSPEKISINSATKTQLELLPSVGEVIAQKIIDNRPFSRIDELINKKIVGEKTFEKLKQLISL